MRPNRGGSRAAPIRIDTSAAPPGAQQDIAPTENGGDDNSAGDHDPAEDNDASGDRTATATAGAAAPLAASNGDDHDWLTRQVIGANDWFSRQTQPLRDFLRAPPGPNDPPPTPKDELGLFPSRVFPGSDVPAKADGTIAETPDRKAASDALEKRRQELAASGVDPKTDPEYRRLQVAKSRADLRDVDDAALMFMPFGGGKGLAGFVERGMSRIGGAAEGAPIAGSAATTPLAKVPPTRELPPSSSVEDTTSTATASNTSPTLSGAPASRATRESAPDPTSPQDLQRAISDLPEKEQQNILGRVVRGDKKGRPFGAPPVGRLPTVEEFNPRIEEVPAGDLEKVVMRTKHGIDPRQAGPVSQLSNEDLVGFRLNEPISATRGENGLSLTGGHHRTAEIINRVNAGTLDPNTPVRILVHD